MKALDIPQSISQKLNTYHLDALSPVWVELLAGTEQIKSFGGCWHHYFNAQPQQGDRISDWCEILQGMLPLDDDFELPHMQIIEGKYTDILAFHDAGSDWLILIDVTDHVLQLQQYQQAANELHLLKDQLKRTLGRYVGEEVASKAIKGELTFDADGERKVITTLFVDIRGFTTYNEKVDAQEVMNTLNAYMNCMLEPILEHHGLVDKIMGDGAMAVFGLLASDNNSVEDAYQAALGIQKRVKKLNKERGNAHLEVLGVGVGIATGDAVLGILGSHERRAFTAIGKHVNLAARLESSARVGEILLDESTLHTLAKTPDYQLITLDLKGIGKSHAYSIIPD
jgi:class 3 adenylate cyclase